jgi:hypothetical protein
MGDGEQQKGQIAEARRFAVKFGLNNLVCVVDRNYLQIGRDTRDVMDQNVEADFAAAGLLGTSAPSTGMIRPRSSKRSPASDAARCRTPRARRASSRRPS